MSKRGLGIDVYTATQDRIRFIFDNFKKVYVSFSGGKDSTVMLHLVMAEARRRGRRVGLLFVDLEAQYTLTIDHVATCYKLYEELIDPFWLAIPLHLRNAVSMFQPDWICWEPGKEDIWVRQPHELSITDTSQFPWYRYAMEFEELVEEFGHWYGEGNLTACFVGIRSDESLNRYRTVVSSKKSCFEGKKWTTWKSRAVFNVYPIYDWRTEDIWTFHARFPDLPYNKLYDRMYQAGLTIHQARICQPYGDDQRKGLWLYHVIEPDTWGKVVARVNGANSGALYAQESGNILGRIRITKPEGHTWESFAMLLLETMPERLREHYKNKIAVFLKWWSERGYPNGIPDEGPANSRTVPSWTRICKMLLRNDYWAKGLSFSQTKSHAYEHYMRVMRRRRQQWGII